MSRQEAAEHYAKALRQGLREVKERTAMGLDPNPAVLYQVAGEFAADNCQYIGLVEIPAHRIVGTRTAGRMGAFSAGFLPLMDRDSEFASKWISLCTDHLSEEGIREPIVCYEYLGEFYVQEGNKRVSVLRSFGAARIPGVVHRVIPPAGDEPRLKAYQEFVEFYKAAGLYDVRFTQPGQYARLCQAVGIPMGQPWTEDDRRRFRAYFQYFREAFEYLTDEGLEVTAEEALMVWLAVYSYADLGKMTGDQLTETLEKMWENIEASAHPAPVVKTEAPAPGRTGILSKIIGTDHLNVAFVHNRTAAASAWTRSHDAGRKHLEEVMGKSVTCRSYFGADTPEQGEAILLEALREGADVIFTTTPQLYAPSLKISVQYPRARILNCSLHMLYSSVQSYYCRIYEGKFITGAIAGAMAKNDRIGYVGTYPIHGEPAAINAFALGAQMTNPRAKIELKWSCQKGNPTREFLTSGIRVISNRDTPSENRIYTDYGTYFYNEEGKAMPLASPTWLWGKFYEKVVRAILSGTWDTDKGSQAVNYWWGMSSGVIDVTFSDHIPEGVRSLAQMLRAALRRNMIDPFFRVIHDQTGMLRCDGSHSFSPEELLKMDWLCDNVEGQIPRLEEVIPESRAMVELLGVFGEDLL